MTTIIVLSLLILFHELGHYLMARRMGVKVEEFGIGLPPRMLKLFTKNGTIFTLNWLPIGGFVRLFGEDGDLNILEKLNPLVRRVSYAGKRSYQRALILVAGVVVNLLIGVIIFSGIYSYTGIPKVERELAVVSQVVEGSPAELAGLKSGDAVLSIGDAQIASADEFVTNVKNKLGQAVTLQVATLNVDGSIGDTSRYLTLVPRENPPEGEGAIGVAIGTIPILSYEKKPWYSAPYYGAIEGVKESYLWGREIVRGLVSLVTSLKEGQLPDELSGPVGVYKAGEEISKTAGLAGTLRFAAILSINLAIFNMLPFPGLDGGRLLFLFFEKILGRRLVNKYENYIHAGGIFILIALLIAITWRDILRAF